MKRDHWGWNHSDVSGEAAMPAVTLKAHYDGERIVLDEPFEIPPNSSLMVTVLPASEALVGDDRILAARKALAGAYGPDEPEYGSEDLRQ
jgi:hypothetical protein